MDVMYLNIRKGATLTDGGSNIHVADVPLWYRPLAGRAASVEEVQAAASQGDVLLVLHGYRNTADAAKGAYAVLHQGLETVGRPKLALVIFAFMPLSQFKLGFTFARMRVGKVARKLRECMALVGNYKHLFVQTHSLGGMVALEMLRDGFFCEGLIMSAPAVDNNAMEPMHSRYGAYLHRAGRILVAHSRRDPVDWPFRFASWDKMLGCSGPEQLGAVTENVVAVDFSAEVDEHGGYKECWRYYKLMADFVEGKEVTA